MDFRCVVGLTRRRALRLTHDSKLRTEDAAALQFFTCRRMTLLQAFRLIHAKEMTDMRNGWKLSSAIVLVCLTISGPAAAAQKPGKTPAGTTIASLKAQIEEQSSRLEKLERQGN